MMYWIVPWVRGDNELYPALPKNHAFGLLAEPGSDAAYGLFECVCEQEDILPTMDRVDDELALLLDSGAHYPPALAIAGESIAAWLGEQGYAHAHEVPRDVFVVGMKRLLREELERQETASWLLVEARQTDHGYLYAGGWYWVVGFDQNMEIVFWVSGDFVIYQNHVSDFAVSPQKLAKRIGPPPPRIVSRVLRH